MLKSERLLNLSKTLNQCYQALGTMTVKGNEAQTFVSLQQSIAIVNNEIVALSDELKICEANCGTEKTPDCLNGKTEDVQPSVQ